MLCVAYIYVFCLPAHPAGGGAALRNVARAAAYSVARSRFRSRIRCIDMVTRDDDRSILNVCFKSTSPSSPHLVLVPIDHRDRYDA